MRPNKASLHYQGMCIFHNWTTGMSSTSSLSHQPSITDSHSLAVVEFKFAFTMSLFRNTQPFRGCWTSHSYKHYCIQSNSSKWNAVGFFEHPHEGNNPMKGCSRLLLLLLHVKLLLSGYYDQCMRFLKQDMCSGVVLVFSVYCIYGLLSYCSLLVNVSFHVLPL